MQSTDNKILPAAKFSISVSALLLWFIKHPYSDNFFFFVNYFHEICHLAQNFKE